MSEALDVWRDAGVGEIREALVRAGRPIALNIYRDTDEGRSARWGEVYCARVREIDRRRRGAFLDLGLRDEQGFLPLGDDGRVRVGRDRVNLQVGEGVVASIVREGVRGKNPVVQVQARDHDGTPPHRLARHESDEHLLRVSGADPAARARLDATVEDALAQVAPIQGGGVLTIEPTAALVAIDVDSGGRTGSTDAERFALDLNIAAAQEAARQVRLRNLAGLIVIDFVSLRVKGHARVLEEAVRAAFADDPWPVQFGGLSRFGLYELSRAQLVKPLHERMRDADGRLSVESIALAALRAIEREGRAQTGRTIACTVAHEVKAWLDQAEFDWRSQLSGRIGMRWQIDSAATLRETIDARAL